MGLAFPGEGGEAWARLPPEAGNGTYAWHPPERGVGPRYVFSLNLEETWACLPRPVTGNEAWT